jgi:hypothetical protein
MELKKIVTISGKGGLFQILKPAKNAIIVESIDELKVRFTVGASARVSVLQEVSIYTHNADGATPLSDVLLAIHQKFPEGITIDIKTAKDEALRAFMADILPDYNASKVYVSDIKKLITWYNLLLKNSPETFNTLVEAPAESTTEKEEVSA